jgi:hypothetical protein
MDDRDFQAHGLIDEFFDRSLPVDDGAGPRWRENGQLDPLTVAQIRMWAANRTLAAFRPGRSDTARALREVERNSLDRWLTDRGFIAPA